MLTEQLIICNSNSVLSEIKEYKVDSDNDYKNKEGKYKLFSHTQFLFNLKLIFFS